MRTRCSRNAHNLVRYSVNASLAAKPLRALLTWPTSARELQRFDHTFRPRGIKLGQLEEGVFRGVWASGHPRRHESRHTLHCGVVVLWLRYSLGLAGAAEQHVAISRPLDSGTLRRTSELSLLFLRENHVPVIPISFRNGFLAFAPNIAGGRGSS